MAGQVSEKRAKDEDSRLFERLPCHFRVEVKDSPTSSFTKAKGYDFSATGLGIVTEKHFLIGSEVELKIIFSKKFEPILTKAKVRWVQPRFWQRWRIGFEFIPLNLGKFTPLFAYR